MSSLVSVYLATGLLQYAEKAHNCERVRAHERERLREGGVGREKRIERHEIDREKSRDRLIRLRL